MKISCYSLDDCFQLSGQPDITEYEPLDDGFGITSIEIEGNTYLQQTEVGLCTYPQENLSDNTVIVHGPREINGYERQLNGEQTLVLGVIVCRHDQPDETTDYQWSRDGSIIHKGHNCCMIHVDQPGQYAVSVNKKTLSTELLVNSSIIHSGSSVNTSTRVHDKLHTSDCFEDLHFSNNSSGA